MKKLKPFIYLIIFLFSSPAWCQNDNDEVQERKFVTDKLRLSLYKKADSNSGTLKLLMSGDVLDVLERSGPYSKVKTVDGLTGWVKNGFLVSIPTASFLLIEEQKKNTELTEQLEKYSNTQKIIDDYENTIEKMNIDNELALQEMEKTKQQLDQISEENKDLKEEVGAYSKNNNHLSWKQLFNILWQYWQVVTAIVLSLFIIGFLTGRKMVQAQVKKRFQGVKVL